MDTAQQRRNKEQFVMGINYLLMDEVVLGAPSNADVLNRGERKNVNVHPVSGKQRHYRLAILPPFYYGWLNLAPGEKMNVIGILALQSVGTQ
jgi:hypothetical protein